MIACIAIRLAFYSIEVMRAKIFVVYQELVCKISTVEYKSIIHQFNPPPPPPPLPPPSPTPNAKCLCEIMCVDIYV